MTSKRLPTSSKSIHLPLIVAIGASAGGLEALKQFFSVIPIESGLAFVVITHLDPTHESRLADILQRETLISAVEVQHKMLPEENRIHIVPPNREMTIQNGVLHLREITVPSPSPRMPIDIFLRSLAEDQQERAIGVILSGTGTDGTLGLRSIRGVGGLCLVQDPVSAQHDGMPRSAIQSGYANYVLPPEKLAEQLLHHVSDSAQLAQSLNTSAANRIELRQVIRLLHAATGHDFSQYKQNTIIRRINRRMSLIGIKDIAAYTRLLKENSQEANKLLDELLINVTSFFRDVEAFAALVDSTISLLLEDKDEHFVFRAWVAGGSTGEEAYSIAIVLNELMDVTNRHFKVKIYSTDIDEDALRTARKGIYPLNIANDVSAERLTRFFTKLDSHYQIKKHIREMIVFAKQDLIKDPPFTKMDLVSCRNVLIYLEPELQDRIIQTLHYALNPAGILFLSPSESIGKFSQLFTPINRKWKIYQAIYSRTALNKILASQPARTTVLKNESIQLMKNNKDINFAEIAKRTLLQNFAPASVLTDFAGNILYVYGETGKFLRPAPGQATLNVVEMAKESLKAELAAAIQAVAHFGAAAQLRELNLNENNVDQQVSLSVRQLAKSDTPQALLLISFQEMSGKPHKKSQKRVKGAESDRNQALEAELAQTRENLQATIDEQQTSNEELQSINEELQSTNEELETSREELHSTNEELVAVNAELQAKIDQLTSMQNDMKNLLDNISIGTIFLDKQLNVRRYTREATLLYNFVPTDIGRPLDQIKSCILAENMLEEARQSLNSQSLRTQEVQTEQGNWYLAQIQPYRTLSNVIDGVVLTFTDISQRVATERAVKDARELAESIIETVHEPLIELDNEFRIVSASNSFFQLFQLTSKETVGQSLFKLHEGQWENSTMHNFLLEIQSRDAGVSRVQIDINMPNNSQQKLLLNGRRIVRPTGETKLILLAIERAEK